jgi:serine/threonine-protein kinase
MTPGRWRQIEELFHAALEKELGIRAAFVAHVSEGDEELRREVESLLAQRSSRGAMLERPAWHVEGSLPETKTQTVYSPGARLGPYQLEELLGAGGMARVYKARDTRLDRTVAIKVCHEEFTQRFQREARAIPQ